jgi:hypothetical protein
MAFSFNFYISPVLAIGLMSFNIGISSPLNLFIQTSLAWKKELLGFSSFRVSLDIFLPVELLIGLRGMLSHAEGFLCY